MRSSCISHPENEPLIIIRKWQIDFCRGNACAAALLSFFSYWHDIRLEMSKKSKTENEIAEGHGDRGTQNTSLLQFHSAKELKDGILVYSEDAIRSGIALLVDLKCLKVFRNPNPRYHFDKTRHFLFNPEVCNFYIKGKSNMVPEIPARSLENPGLSWGNQTPITETTSETTYEIEKKDQKPLVERQALYPPQETQRANIKNLELKSTNQEEAMDLTPPLGPPRHIPDYERAIRAVKSILFPKYRDLCEKSNSYSLTEQRLKKGISRFLECLKKSDGDWAQAGVLFETAIEELAKSDWHMGRNKDQPKKYNDWIDNLCKSQEQFEKWLDKADEGD